MHQQLKRQKLTTAWYCFVSLDGRRDAGFRRIGPKSWHIYFRLDNKESQPDQYVATYETAESRARKYCE